MGYIKVLFERYLFDSFRTAKCAVPASASSGRPLLATCKSVSTPFATKKHIHEHGREKHNKLKWANEGMFKSTNNKQHFSISIRKTSFFTGLGMVDETHVIILDLKVLLSFKERAS